MVDHGQSFLRPRRRRAISAAVVCRRHRAARECFETGAGIAHGANACAERTETYRFTSAGGFVSDFALIFFFLWISRSREPRLLSLKGGRRGGRGGSGGARWCEAHSVEQLPRTRRKRGLDKVLCEGGCAEKGNFIKVTDQSVTITGSPFQGTPVCEPARNNKKKKRAKPQRHTLRCTACAQKSKKKAAVLVTFTTVGTRGGRDAGAPSPQRLGVASTAPRESVSKPVRASLTAQTRVQNVPKRIVSRVREASFPTLR